MSNYKITVNGVTYDVTVEMAGLGKTPAFAPAAPKAAPAPAPAAQPAPAPKAAPAPAPKAEAPKPAPKAAAPAGGVSITAPVIGKIWKIVVSQGQTVAAGADIVILESMKMEIPVVAPQGGTVASINVKEGDAVEVGDLIASLN